MKKIQFKMRHRFVFETTKHSPVVGSNSKRKITFRLHFVGNDEGPASSRGIAASAEDNYSDEKSDSYSSQNSHQHCHDQYHAVGGYCVSVAVIVC